MAEAFHAKPEQALAEFEKAQSLAPNNADILLLIS